MSIQPKSIWMMVETVVMGRFHSSVAFFKILSDIFIIDSATHHMFHKSIWRQKYIFAIFAFVPSHLLSYQDRASPDWFTKTYAPNQEAEERPFRKMELIGNNIGPQMFIRLRLPNMTFVIKDTWVANEWYFYK